jgi:hypothetical protein
MPIFPFAFWKTAAGGGGGTNQPPTGWDGTTDLIFQYDGDQNTVRLTNPITNPDNMTITGQGTLATFIFSGDASGIVLAPGATARLTWTLSLPISSDAETAVITWTANTDTGQLLIPLTYDP